MRINSWRLTHSCKLAIGGAIHRASVPAMQQCLLFLLIAVVRITIRDSVITLSHCRWHQPSHTYAAQRLAWLRKHLATTHVSHGPQRLTGWFSGLFHTNETRNKAMQKRQRANFSSGIFRIRSPTRRNLQMPSTCNQMPDGNRAAWRK